jgi:hypothetical protein
MRWRSQLGLVRRGRLGFLVFAKHGFLVFAKHAVCAPTSTGKRSRLVFLDCDVPLHPGHEIVCQQVPVLAELFFSNYLTWLQRHGVEHSRAQKMFADLSDAMACKFNPDVLRKDVPATQLQTVSSNIYLRAFIFFSRIIPCLKNIVCTVTHLPPSVMWSVVTLSWLHSTCSFLRKPTQTGQLGCGTLTTNRA